MPRTINQENDKKVLDFLKNHTYKETTEKLGVSSRTIKRIKDRNNPTESKANSKVNSKVEIKSQESIKIMIDLFKKSIPLVKFKKSITNSEIEAIDYLEGLL